MNGIVDINFLDLVDSFTPKEVFNREMIILELDSTDRFGLKSSDRVVRLNALTFFFAIRGELTLDIDYLTYNLRPNMMLDMAGTYTIENISFSNDFRGFMIMVEREFMKEVFTGLPRLPRTSFFSNRLDPIRHLEEGELTLLLNNIRRIRTQNDRLDHTFHTNIVRNEMSTLLMEMGNILAKRSGEEISFGREGSRKEEVAKQFIQLLLKHCREEHEVSFYSNELCMTPEYLTKIMKSFSGRTVNQWIGDALIAEAKVLLRKPGSVIQEVAETLNFSDQSYFGKFFKKHTGKTPLEYKNSLEN